MSPPRASTPDVDHAAPRVAVVIVNYRTAPLVIEGLHALQAEIAANPGTRVYVVDNDSQDGSAQAIAEAIRASGWTDWAVLLPSSVNGRFAYGNNFAVRPLLASTPAPDFFWLLNPDTVVRTGALQALLQFMQRHLKAGIIGGSFEESSGALWPIAFRFPSLLGELDNGLRLGVASRVLQRWTVARQMRGVDEQVDWLGGASMLVRREVFETVGLMDEGYFLYYEETDFCLRARRRGWENWYVPLSRVMHIGGQSTGVTARGGTPKRLPKYWFDSRRRYFVKNHGRLYAMAADLAWAASFALWRMRRPLQFKADEDPPRLLWDFIRYSSFFRA